jgi:hypothetical protein
MAIAIFLLFASAGSYGQASQLTPIGSTIDATNSDDSHSLVDLTSVFPYGINFGGTVYDNLYVGTNGYVTFGSGHSSYSPQGIAGWNTGYPIIAAQFDDLHPGNGGNVYYYQNTSNNYIVATYVTVEPYNTPVEWGYGPDGTSFQIILRKPSDYSSSNKNFIIEVRYNDIGWHQAAINSSPPTAGWSTGDQTTYAEMPYSGSTNFHLNESNSNIGQTGVYQWDVEGGVVQSPPTVNETSSISSVTYNSAESGGNVSSDGGASVTERGTVWSTSSPPFYSDNYSADGGSGTGSFNSSISGLSPNTTYYVRAYATNSEGTGYGPERSFTTDRKELTIDGSFTANNKTYDGLTSATIATDNLSLNGIIGSDDVSLTNVAVDFATVDKGTGIAVNITNADLTGTDAGKYTVTLSGAPSTTADITARELTVSGAIAEDKVYDGTTEATVTGSTLNGLVSGDEVSLDNAGAGTFAQHEAGAGIAVTTSMTISGADAANYSLSQPAGLSADITPKELTVSGAIAEDKIYEGTTEATVTGSTLNGLVSGDEVSLDHAGSGTFAQHEAGAGIAVTTSMTISGADAANYSLSQPAGLSADITPKELTVSGASADNKIYDGTTEATVTGATLNGLVSGDEVSLDNAGAGTFAQHEAGAGIAVTTSMTISGADAANYSLSQPAGLSADITPKELTIGGSFAVNNKTYDGSTSATMASDNLSLNGIVGSDDVTLTTVEADFITADKGNAIAVQLTNAKLTGADAGEYTVTLSGSPAATADIAARELTVSGAIAEDKVYDGTPDATITGASLSGLVSGDAVSLDHAGAGTFARADAGTGIAVSNSMTISGADADNYNLTRPEGLSADINQKELTVTADDQTRETCISNPQFTISYSGFVQSEDANVLTEKPQTSCTADKTSGAGMYTIHVSGGSDENYHLNYQNGTLTITGDATKPLISVKDTTAYLSRKDTLKLTPNDLLTNAYDACGLSDTTISHPDFSTDNVGENIVSVTVRDINGNRAVQTAVVTIHKATDVKTLSGKDISVYPNPARNMLHVECTDHSAQQVKLINLVGRTVLHETNVNGTHKLDISGLENGIYLLQIESDNQTVTKKIIKQ